ncbi:WD repeat-containing protein 61-like [Planoprotostelium fungivorum]|uniref:WD repeat-containing protein 61-like n=1 Tax=Planoprotostelium fungivorum TaxID=1890364 RepID=A0A2P6NW55_9EUKA|nr:WD repeat-containing protein 61-like [Planoprotostelium fungivorum]
MVRFTSSRNPQHLIGSECAPKCHQNGEIDIQFYNEVAYLSPYQFSVAKKIDKAHEDGIWSVVWKGDKIYTGSVDTTVKSWKSNDLSNIRTMEGHGLGVVCVAIDPTGQNIASSSLDSSIRIWSAEDGSLLNTIDAGPVESWAVQFSPDGRYIASTGQSGNVTLWSTDGKKEQVLPTNGAFTMSVAFSPDGKQLATGSMDGVVTVFDVEAGKKISTIQGHAMAVRTLTFGQHNTPVLITGSDDMHVKIHDLSSNHVIGSVSGHASWVLAVATSPNGKTFATGSSDKKVKLWDLSSRQCQHTFAEHDDQVWSVAFDATGDKLASQTIPYLWKHKFPPTINCIEFGNVRNGSTTIIMGLNDGRLRLWNQEVEELIETKGGSIQKLCLHPKGKEPADLIVGDAQGNVVLFASGEILSRIVVDERDQLMLIGDSSGHVTAVRSPSETQWSLFCNSSQSQFGTIQQITTVNIIDRCGVKSHPLVVTDGTKQLRFYAKNQLVFDLRLPSPVCCMCTGYFIESEHKGEHEQIAVACRDGKIYIVNHYEAKPYIRVGHIVTQMKRLSTKKREKYPLDDLVCTGQYNSIQVYREGRLKRKIELDDWAVCMTVGKDEEKGETQIIVALLDGNLICYAS